MKPVPKAAGRYGDCGSFFAPRFVTGADGGGTTGPASIWAIVLTLENATVSWRELSRHLMVSDPTAFGSFAAELTELPLLDQDGCPLCAERARLAA